jgi:ribosomal subunit interface protein
MNYQITSDNIEISESMKTLALKKLSKIEVRLKDVHDDLKSTRVVLNSAPKDNFIVKVEVIAEGTKFFVENTNYNLETALIAAVEEIEKQIEKSKYGSAVWEKRRRAKRFETPKEDMGD